MPGTLNTFMSNPFKEGIRIPIPQMRKLKFVVLTDLPKILSFLVAELSCSPKSASFPNLCSLPPLWVELARQLATFSPLTAE